MASYFIELFNSVLGLNTVTLLLFTATFILASIVYNIITAERVEGKLPPHVPSSIPFVGEAYAFGKNPVEYVLSVYNKYGPVFSITMMGQTFTFLIGSEASALFFNSKNEALNAEEVYSRLTTPVFGKGVAYDVPNHIFLEQKKIFKTGLNVARFRNHVHMIEEETEEYLKRWGDSGVVDLFKALSELIILTASRCLHGKEIRAALNEHVAQMYADLDGGFTQLAWLFPGWMPFPSFRKRDRAHAEMKQLFYEAIRKRRNSDPDDDMLQTLLDSVYKSGRHLTDDEVAGMLIGLLMAGQHTSSTTGSWLGFFVAQNKELQDRLYEEQLSVCGKSLPPLNYDDVKRLDLLDNTMKEALRLRPPIFTAMRLCKSPQKVLGFTIPKGHQVCVSPNINHKLPDTWKNSAVFNPDRFLDPDVANSEKFSYVPFGAGRHRCIGESFAYVQVKTLWSVLLRTYEFELVDGQFPTVNFATMLHTPSNPYVRYKLRKH